MNSDQAVATVLISIFVGLLLGAAIYVWVALALSKVFVKFGVDAWKAWVPALNLVEVFRLGGQNPLWVIALFIPVAQAVGLVFFVIALHKINQRFGKGPGFTVLAALVFPVWATIVGFGSARPVQQGADAAAAAVRPVQPYSPTPPAPAAPVSPPTYAVAPVAAPMVAAPPLPVVPAAPAAPLTPAAFVPAAPQAPAPAPVAPPAPPAPALEVPEAPPPPPAPPLEFSEQAAPTAPSAVRSQAVPAAQYPFISEADDSTVVVPRRAKHWVLQSAQGQKVVLEHPIALLGRDPAGDSGFPGAQLVALVDAERSVSKTHARLELVDGVWHITDLHSTNGVELLGPDDTVTELAPQQRETLGERFLLGDLELQLTRDRA